MISLHYTSHTKAYNTIYTTCNIVEAIYSFTACEYHPDSADQPPPYTYLSVFLYTRQLYPELLWLSD